MKKVTIEKSIKETKYQSNDGTLFTNEKDCQNYEKSLLGILKAKYSKLKKKEFNEYNFLNNIFGCEDYNIDVVKISKKEDIDTIMQLCLYYYPTKSQESIDYDYARLLKVFEEEDTIIIGKGNNYEPNFYILGDSKSFIEYVTNAVKV